jgi:outer membrane biogenesis lipoprotein LolB
VIRPVFRSIFRRLILRILPLLLAGAGFAGCAVLRPPPPPTPEAEAAWAAVQNFNREIRTFKGSGTAELVRDDARQLGRAVWVGKAPAHLRVSLLDPVGRPISTLMTDGEVLAARMGPGGNGFRAHSANPSLSPALGISIRARDAIRLLAGRAPAAAPRGIVLEENRLTLTDRWNRRIFVLELDPDHRRPLAVERYAAGERLYRAALETLEAGPEGIHPPSRLTLVAGDESARFDLRVDRFWVNQSLPARAFALEPPR